MASLLDRSLAPARYAGPSSNSLHLSDFSLEATSGVHMTGTSIMAVEYDGGVVVGADSRTTTGSYIANRVSDKLTSVHDYIICCRSGSAADTQAVADYVKLYLELQSVESNRIPRVKTAASLFRQICYENKDRLLAGIICAGWDPIDGGSVYNIPLGGSVVREKFAIGGSGSTYIYGYCDSAYREGMNKEECQQFVIRALSHAMARDGSSGGVIRLATIDSTGVNRMFIGGNELPYMDHEGI
eukprot:TRINITY_DN2141_c0_g1_i1.p1 TRINITY_DN2141_c0_g1~~TRINITY_DN2141_c0_g1_i1.p1  ORF type:complete len:258 (+),score=68.56 TRINITY_DN2141_c0_g1_i1:50-775(+)